MKNKLTRLFATILCLALAASCGKKSGLIYPEKTKKPDFRKEIE